MADLLILTLALTTIALGGLSFYFRSEAGRLYDELTHCKQQIDTLKHGTDMEKLAEAYGLRSFEVSRQINRRELARLKAEKPEIMQRELEQMKEEMLQRLTDEGVFRVVREDLPSKPYITFRMNVRACDDSQMPDAEQTLNQFKRSHQRTLGTSV